MENLCCSCGLTRVRSQFGFYEYPMEPSPELLWLWQEVGVLVGSEYSADAATTASSVNNSLIAAEMVVAAGGPRPDILTYVWLWPDAVPVSAAQLAASVVVPAGMGADGIIIWGSSEDAHVGGYSGTITSFLEAAVGPLIEGCAAHTAQCAAALCSGHGRCSSFDPAAPEKGCLPPASPADVKCVCDDGWTGPKCGTKALQPR